MTLHRSGSIQFVVSPTAGAPQQHPVALADADDDFDAVRTRIAARIGVTAALATPTFDEHGAEAAAEPQRGGRQLRGTPERSPASAERLESGAASPGAQYYLARLEQLRRSSASRGITFRNGVTGLAGVDPKHVSPAELADGDKDAVILMLQQVRVGRRRPRAGAPH